MAHDTPLLHYVAFLADHYNYALYKDVFDFNMPGAVLFHLSIGKLLGYGDLAFRLTDIAWLCALLFVTWGIMSQFGKRVAWASVILFGLSYFQHGPAMSLQRDYVGMLPIGMAIFIVISRPQLSLSIRAFLVGILFGISATIKPPLVIGLPLVLFFQWKQTYRTNTDEIPITSPLSIALSISFFSFLGFAVPMFGSILWLWRQGSLPYLWEIYSSYLPLYLSLTGEHKTIFGIDRLKYLIESYLHLGGHSTWLIPACLGLFIASFDAMYCPPEKRHQLSNLG